MNSKMVKEGNQSSIGKEFEQTSIGSSKLSVSVIQEESNNDDDELLKTPTGPEHKIPPPLQCPGAPPRVKTFNKIPFNTASVRYMALQFEQHRQVDESTYS
ncbi:hypothetical protein TSUD_113160 [Trifolium subterraneum]|uniref:Uncharacterized protein n=1 Tax=Trifolium subterraneum TaxID=3900 RepID=A0A2Z6LG12_TRISU|nr:hypothetical protein TSUD_113160 [Trifolium subterraneum]